MTIAVQKNSSKMVKEKMLKQLYLMAAASLLVLSVHGAPVASSDTNNNNTNNNNTNNNNTSSTTTTGCDCNAIMAAQSFPTNVKPCTQPAGDCCTQCGQNPSLDGTLSCRNVDFATQIIYGIGPNYCKFNPANGNDVAMK